MDARTHLIAAIDVDCFEKAEPLVKELAPYVGMLKAGLELITAEGAPRVVEFFRSHGANLFLDVKYHDIPTTMGRAAAVASSLGVAAFNVHASSGMEALLAARRYTQGPRLWAVTVLTSHDDASWELVYGALPSAKVLQYARDAKFAGFDGIICSPQELVMLRQHDELCGLEYVTPGIRPDWAPSDDQKRVTTPHAAIRAGAKYLVVGRPITNPPDGISRVTAVRRILGEIEQARQYLS